MNISLMKTGAAPIVLPSDMVWADQFTYSPVGQSAEFSIEGAVVVDAAATQSGREITLVCGESYAWLNLLTVTQLRNLAQTPGEVMTLTIGTSNFKVIFRHNEPPAVDVQPLVELSEYTNGDYFHGSLKFLEVQ